jgi:hypothetical protein
VCWPTLTKIFSTFDTRDLDKSQPQMNCGTHIITGGTGKCKGITGMRRSRTRHLGDNADRLRGDWFRDLSPDEEEHDGFRSRLIVVGDDPAW